MSRGAYRLRRRDPDGLFAAIWDLALSPAPVFPELFFEGHIERLGSGPLMRLLGNDFRRQSDDFINPSRQTQDRAERLRT